MPAVWPGFGLAPQHKVNSRLKAKKPLASAGPPLGGRAVLLSLLYSTGPFGPV